MEDFYDYTVLQEIKDSLYDYNEKQISRDIQNYLFATNFDMGTKQKCVCTNEVIEITADFFDSIERRFLGEDSREEDREKFRKYIHRKYISKTLTQEMQGKGKSLPETELYKKLHEQYVSNIREKILDPLLTNKNFRRALQDYGEKSFVSYDKQIRQGVNLLITNLQKKFNYTKSGAKEVCVYAIDHEIAEKFD